jgi:replication factor A1
VTPEGASYIIAQELGINLFKGKPKNHDLKVENVIPRMTNVDIVGKVVKVFPVKEFNKKNGSTGIMGSFILGDETGTIRVVLWGNGASILSQGSIKEEDVLRIKNGYTKANQDGEPEIHINNASKIITNPGDVDPDDIRVGKRGIIKLNMLNEGMGNVNILCKVLHISETREFERDDKTKGKVANLVVADETAKARLVLWDEAVKLLERDEISVGDTIKVEKGYMKKRYGEMEINVGKYGRVVVNPEEGSLDVKIDEKVVVAKEIKELNEGDEAIIVGALVEIYGYKVFQRKNGMNGMVVNAALDDGTGCIRAAFYDKQVETLLSKAFGGDKDLGDELAGMIEKRKKELLGREVMVRADVRHNDFSGQNVLVVREIILDPDPREIIKELLEEIKIMEG